MRLVSEIVGMLPFEEHRKGISLSLGGSLSLSLSTCLPLQSEEIDSSSISIQQLHL